MTRSFSHAGIVLALLCSLTSHSHCMDTLPDDVLPLLAIQCTPTSRNALRKVSKKFWEIVSKNKILQLLTKSAYLQCDDDGNVTTRYRLKFSPPDLDDALLCCIKSNDVTLFNDLVATYSISPDTKTRRVDPYIKYLECKKQGLPFFHSADKDLADTINNDALEEFVLQNIYQTTLDGTEQLLTKLTMQSRPLPSRALHIAVDNNDIPMTKLLLSFDIICQPNLHRSPADFESTPLQIASTKGYPALVKLLLDTKKYNPNKTDEALRMALSKNHFECVSTILCDSPKLVKADLFATAVLNDNAEFVEFLIGTHKPGINQCITIARSGHYAEDPGLETLLHRAVRNKAAGIVNQIVNQLVKDRVSLKEKNSESLTALELARILLAQEEPDYRKTSEYQEIIKILLNDNKG